MAEQETARDGCDRCGEFFDFYGVHSPECERERLIAERDRHREALSKIVDYAGWSRSNSWKIEQVRETAREALDG